jgi:hypothetical protein
MVIYGFSGSPWSIPNVVMYLVGGAVMEEVESNVTGIDPITLDTRTKLVAATLKPRRGVEK